MANDSSVPGPVAASEAKGTGSSTEATDAMVHLKGAEYAWTVAFVTAIQGRSNARTLIRVAIDAVDLLEAEFGEKYPDQRFLDGIRRIRLRLAELLKSPPKTVSPPQLRGI